MVLCELCGKNVSEAYRVEVLGSSVVACGLCAKSGRILGPIKPAEKKRPQPAAVREKPAVLDDEDWSLVDDCGRVVKTARERSGLRQEELAKKISEPESLLHRIESGRIRPNPAVARKIEKTLNVRLIMESESGEFDFNGGGGADSTLGDVVVVRERKK